MDGHGGEPEPCGGGHAPDAEDEGACQVDEVGAVFGDRGGDAPAGQGDADLRVAGEREGGDPDDGARSGRVRLVAGGGDGGGCDDDAVVTAADEVPGGLERAVGDTVHIGGKDSVTMTTPTPVLSPDWTCSRQSRSFRPRNVP